MGPLTRLAARDCCRLFGNEIRSLRADSGHSSTAWRKGSNQRLAAALQELGARLLQPRGGPPLSSEVWRPERRLQSLLAAGSQRPDIVARPPIGPLAPCVFSGALTQGKKFH